MSFPRPEFMRLALRLARKGAGRTSPNPAVGAVLVRGGKGVGQGDHRAGGLPPAGGMGLRTAGGASSLNRPCCRWMEAGKPFVTLKLAVSMDGQIAASSGESRWISGEAARTMVHRMRAEADAVLVGGRTFRRDAPMLTARVPLGGNPKRVILPSPLAPGRRAQRGGGSSRRAPWTGTCFFSPRSFSAKGSGRSPGSPPGT